ncbi:MAG: hypothetical protein KDC23_00320 [Actinobacteria bacterium]|nr:hypothetical protein [Actinomycetota bacterium]
MSSKHVITAVTALVTGLALLAAPMAGIGNASVGGTPPAIAPMANAEGFNEVVLSLSAADDGKVWVGGAFTTPSDYVARLNPDGTVDPTFDSSAIEDFVWSVSAYPGGKVIAGGRFMPDPITRLNSDGTQDATFDPAELDGPVGSVVTLPDGKVMVGGYFSEPDPLLTRLNPDGSHDDTFQQDEFDWKLLANVRKILPVADGKVVVTVVQDAGPYLLRFNSDGSVDPTFNPPAFPEGVESLADAGNGRIYVGGNQDPNIGGPVVRLNQDGSLDPTFEAAGFNSPIVDSLLVTPAGQVVAGGSFQSPVPYLALLENDGSPVAGFVPPDLDARVNATAFLPNGSAVLGGFFTTPEDYLTTTPLTPWAPTNLVATPGYSSAVVDFTFGANGGSPVTGVEYSTDGGVTWVPTGSTAPTATVAGLPNGVQTEILLRARNAVGPGAAASVSVTPVGAVFSGLESSFRVFDSRPSEGGAGPLQPGVPVVVDVQAPEGAVAVAYNVTLVDTVGTGHVAVGPAGADLSGTSTANWFATGQRWANAYVSALDEAGMIQVVARGGATEAIVDVTGFYLADGTAMPNDEPAAGPGGAGSGSSVTSPAAVADSLFVPTAPVRAYDSRGIDGPIFSGQERTVDLSPWVPAGATGVAYTLTVTDTVGSGHLAVGVPGTGKPATSIINWFASGQNVANSASGVVNEGREVAVFAGGGPTQFVIDILGYFTPVAEVSATGDVGAANGQQGLRFTAIPPSRAYDSRTVDGPIAGGQARTTTVITASGQVPAGAGAVAFNLTETDTLGRGHLRVAPGGSGIPAVSTINWYTDDMRVANGSVVAVNGDQMTTYARTTRDGSSQYLVDIGGYYN